MNRASAIKALNDLAMKRVGVGYEEFLDIVHEATNTVQASLGLEPFDKECFRARYMWGMLSGGQVYFYVE